MKDLPPELAKKQFYAQKLYEAGQTAIYRPPSHAGMYVASWAMGGSAVTIASVVAYTNRWTFDTNLDVSWIVPVAYNLGVIAFSCIGWIIIMRSFRFISSIDLVSVDGLVKMAVQVRRPLPFLKPKGYLIAPYQFEMDKKFVMQMEEPEFMQDDEEPPNLPETQQKPQRGLLSEIGRGISKVIYYPFASTRRLMTLEGFMWVSFDGVSGKMKLDTQGRFSNGARDLVEMGRIRL
jgi:hypothetical protein